VASGGLRRGSGESAELPTEEKEAVALFWVRERTVAGDREKL
jgi:hypothetical protein